MAKNANLHAAKKAKNDEFYTRYEDIQAELIHYQKHFKGKVVYCNCDDPAESNFVKFFCDVFEDWGLKELIATHYDPDEEVFTYHISITEDRNGDGDITPEDMVRTDLPCNGDFRSAACIELLKRADIVVTNPPFSLFREYVAQLVEYDKKFVIIGNPNAITYKEIFPLLKENTIWLGYRKSSGGGWYKVPVEFERAIRTGKQKATWKDRNGTFLVNCPMIWFTNLDIPKRHQPLEIRGNRYYGNEDKYPKYANYDAIEVSRVADIPEDYVPCWFDCEHAGACVYAKTEGLEDNALCEQSCNGEMGVPITYLDKHCEEQFDLVGQSRQLGKPTSEIVEDKSLFVQGGVRFYLPDEDAVDSLNAQRSTLNAQRSTLNAQRSTLNAQRTAVSTTESSSEEVQRSDGRTHHLPGQALSGAVRDSGDNVSRVFARTRNTRVHKGRISERKRSEWFGNSDGKWRSENDLSTTFGAPCSKCSGVMGVPITFLDKHCVEQFEVVGLVNGKDTLSGIPTMKDYSEYQEIRQTGELTGSTGKKINGNPVLIGRPRKGNYYITKNGLEVYSTYARIFIRKA